MEKKPKENTDSEEELSEEELIMVQLDAFGKATAKFQNILGSLGETVTKLGTRLESLEKRLESIEDSEESGNGED